MFHLARRGLLVVGLVLLSLLLGAATLNQTVPECPQGETPNGCAQVTLNPSEAAGDFYVDGVLVATAQNPGWLVLTPDIEHIVEIKNIQSTEENFGTLFNYPDIPASTIKVRAGETKVKTIRLTKNYVRGTLKFICDVKNAALTDAVSCRVTIDGTVQPDVVAGQAASYILDPGDRLMLVEIIGEQASLFDPLSKERTVKIYAGSWATNLKVTFTKKGHLFLSLDQAGVVADLYLDGTPIATQVATYDMWVAPNKNHKIEAKSFTDPAAGGVYTWKDAKQTVYVRAGTDKTVTLKLRKQYIKGFLAIKCSITNIQSGENAYCQPRIDGALVQSVSPGAIVEYVLDPGNHSITIGLGPEATWFSTPIAITRYIVAGRTSNYTATFTLQRAVPAAAQAATVTRIVDGDTIDVRIDNAAFRVRYIGINTPETNQVCGSSATAANRSLVSGKTVGLVKDISETDIYGRLLRYVYVGDLFVNAVLVQQGWAEAVAYPPDTRYADYFRSLEQQAKAANIGCWPTGVWNPPPPPTAPPSSEGSPVCSCSGNIYNCGNFSTHAQAQACYQYCLTQVGYDVHQLDGDNDGSACESLP